MLNGNARRTIIKRDKKKCFLCGRKTRLEVHHVINQQSGGNHAYCNLITLCRRCHILNGAHKKLYENNVKFLDYLTKLNEPKDWEDILESDCDVDYKSDFDKLVRIRKKQLDWLKLNKTTKTIAGFLDTIINKYKNGKN